MSEDQLKAFWEAIQADAGLLQKLQGVTEPDAVAAIAKEAGFNISAEEIKKAHSELELTDDQLETVVGGGGSPENCSLPSCCCGICEYMWK